MIEVKLCSVPELDNTYSNVIDFTTKTKRNTFFDSRKKKSFELNVKPHSMITQITVPFNVSELDNVDYLIVGNYFYFINTKNHHTDTTSLLYVQLDVFTTYHNDITILDSYVERCHVDRWVGDTPTKHTIDEGLPLGEYVQGNIEDIYTYNNGLVIASTTPLGVVDFEPSSGGSTTRWWRLE